MQPWKTLSRTPILNHSEYLKVEEHAVQLPDGGVILDWPWVISNDYINVAAVADEGTFLCFRQTKYGLEGTSLAPVGGHVEPGEDPKSAAARELMEETGYQAREWIHLGTYQENGNRGVATAYLYLALGAHRLGEPQPDDLEEQVLLHLSRPEVVAALKAGEFKVLAWATVMALALLHLDERPDRE